jgi:GT2 family glycosyltransferase
VKFNTVIVLINYNSLADTIECIKSIISGNATAKPFVIIVENGSKDQKDIDLIPSLYYNSHVIKNYNNVGFGNANNIAIKWVKDNLECNFIFILNNDTLIEKDALLLLENGMNSASPEVGMAAPKILVYSNPEEIWYGGGNINYNKVSPSINNFSSVNNYTIFASGCAMFFRAEVLYALEGFDPFFFMYDEDVELCIRLQNMKRKILYIPRSIIYHKCQGSQTKKANIPSNQLHPNHPSLIFYLKNTIVNRKYIIKKHLVKKNKLKSTFFHTLYWLAKSSQYLLYGKLKATICVINQLLFVSIKSKRNFK